MILAAIGDAYWARFDDALRWPKSGQERIDSMAQFMRENEGRNRSCYDTRNTKSIDYNHRDGRFGACFKRLEPVSDFIEEHPGQYIKRFYRGRIDGYFCEATLSTVHGDDRIVGSDCYYGLFHEGDDTGIGMTDDPFG